MNRRARGFSLIELLVVVAIILIIAAIAIPNLLKSRMAANESATVGNMKTITTALGAYSTLYPACGYPASLTQLAPGTPPTNTAAGLLDPVMANNIFVKSGYTVTYTLVAGVGDCVGATGSDYEIKATPAVLNKTGVRGFFVDSSNVIRADASGTATAASPAL